MQKRYENIDGVYGVYFKREGNKSMPKILFWLMGFTHFLAFFSLRFAFILTLLKPAADGWSIHMVCRIQ